MQLISFLCSINPSRPLANAKKRTSGKKGKVYLLGEYAMIPYWIIFPPLHEQYISFISIGASPRKTAVRYICRSTYEKKHGVVEQISWFKKMANEGGIYNWSRDEVSSCNCSEKLHRHVHCRCWNCQGKATDRSTEMRHWRETRMCAAGAADGCVQQSPSDSPENMEFQEQENDLPDLHAGSEQDGLFRGDEASREAYHRNGEDGEDDNINPLRRLVVKAVLDALAIMDDGGTSVKTFQDILDYGKRMLFTSVGGDLDVDILSAPWPENWNAVQSLLVEEGFSDCKEYCICICREEKEVKRDGKVRIKYQYSRKWSIMDSKDELCPHCGSGYIKYYYLGLNGKIKNWFRSKLMCEKMLSHWKEKEHWLGRSSSLPL